MTFDQKLLQARIAVLDAERTNLTWIAETMEKLQGFILKATSEEEREKLQLLLNVTLERLVSCATTAHKVGYVEHPTSAIKVH